VDTETTSPEKKKRSFYLIQRRNQTGGATARYCRGGGKGEKKAVFIFAAREKGGEKEGTNPVLWGGGERFGVLWGGGKKKKKGKAPLLGKKDGEGKKGKGEKIFLSHHENGERKGDLSSFLRGRGTRLNWEKGGEVKKKKGKGGVEEESIKCFYPQRKKALLPN